MIPHPELLRLLAELVRDVAKAGPEPVLQASERVVYLGWLVRGLHRGDAANESVLPPDSS